MTRKPTSKARQPPQPVRNRPAAAEARALQGMLHALHGEPRGRALRIGLAIGMSPTRFSPLSRLRGVVLDRPWTS